MKKTISCFVCLVALLLMGGCGHANEPQKNENPAPAPEITHTHEHKENESQTATPKIEVKDVQLTETDIPENHKKAIKNILNKAGEHTDAASASFSTQHKTDLGVWIVARNYSALSEEEQNKIIYAIGRDAKLENQQRNVIRIDFGSLSLFATSTELTEKISPYIAYMEEVNPNTQLSAIEKCFMILEIEGEKEDATK